MNGSAGGCVNPSRAYDASFHPIHNLMTAHGHTLDINASFRGGGRSVEWLDKINKASIVMLAETGIVPKDVAKRIAKGIAKVIENEKTGEKRTSADYLDYEPRLIAVAGQVASRLHTGRSRQDLASTIARINLCDGHAPRSTRLTTGIGTLSGHVSKRTTSVASDSASSPRISATAAFRLSAVIGFAENDTQSRNFASRRSQETGFFESPGTLVGLCSKRRPSRVTISTEVFETSCEPPLPVTGWVPAR
jgi:hypothetical protein